MRQLQMLPYCFSRFFAVIKSVGQILTALLIRRAYSAPPAPLGKVYGRLHALVLSARQTAARHRLKQKAFTSFFVKVFEGVGNFFQKVSDIAPLRLPHSRALRYRIRKRAKKLEKSGQNTRFLRLGRWHKVAQVVLLWHNLSWFGTNSIGSFRNVYSGVWRAFFQKSTPRSFGARQNATRHYLN